MPVIICNSWGSFFFFFYFYNDSHILPWIPLLNFCSSSLKHLKFLGIWEKWLIASIDFSQVRKHGGMKLWIGNSKFPLPIHFLKGILRWLSRQNVSEFLNIKKFFILCLKVTNAHIYVSVLASYGMEKSCLDVSKLDKLFRRRFQLFSIVCVGLKKICAGIFVHFMPYVFLFVYL